LEAEPPSRDAGDAQSHPSGQLVLRCAMCRRTFPSGIYPPRQACRAMELEGRVHECPFCGFITAYDPTDYGHAEGKGR